MRPKQIGQSPEYNMLYEILRKINRITDLAPHIGWNTGESIIDQLITAYVQRVEADGGVVESEECLIDRITNLKTLGFWDKASAIWLPHGYKEGKLYAVKGGASADLPFVRNGTRTRKGANYIEEVPYNLYQHSQSFSNPIWILSTATITENQTIAPDNSLTADLFSVTSAGGLIRQGTTQDSGIIYNNSIYVKRGTATHFHMVVAGALIYAQWDLTTGVLVHASAGSGELISTSIESVGNEWYRLSLASRHSQGSPVQFRFYALSEDSNTPFPNTTQSCTAYIWGAQQSYTSELKNYLRTTTRFNVPAIDYTNSTCPALSLEPARTNLFLWSEDFSNAVWGKIGLSILSNNTTAPNSLLTAAKCTADGTSVAHRLAGGLNSVSGTTYTASFFVKYINTQWVQLFFSSTGFSGQRVNFDLLNGVIGSADLNTNPTITSYGDGWYRITATATSTNSVTSSISLYHVTSSGSSSSEVNTLSTSYYVWGAQAEAGTYATSYIPTTTGTVTRIADGIPPLTVDLMGQTEGTLYFETRPPSNDTSRVFSISDGGQTNRVFITISSLGDIRGGVVAGGITQFNHTGGPLYTAGTIISLAITYKNNYSAIFMNGVKLAEDLSIIVPTTTRINFADGNGTSPIVGDLIKAAIFKVAISDTEAIALTTP